MHFAIIFLHNKRYCQFYACLPFVRSSNALVADNLDHASNKTLVVAVLEDIFGGFRRTKLIVELHANLDHIYGVGDWNITYLLRYKLNINFGNEMPVSSYGLPFVKKFPYLLRLRTSSNRNHSKLFE